ncbi:hypothetical protein ACLBWP_02655 [Microbacterium sp. M1A1_1b]
MQEHEVVRRAAELWDKGGRAAALTLLRDHLREDPQARQVRLALVERYRELGAPDQAGRWALAVSGLATSVERDRAARLLAASGVARDDLRAFLALPTDTPLPDEVDGLMADVDRYREQFGADMLDRTGGRGDRFGDALESTGLVVVCAWLATVVIVWGGTVLGAHLTEFARWATTAALASCAVFCGVMVVRRSIGPQRRSAIVWGAAAVVLAAAVVRLVSLGVVGDGVIRFAWER